MPRFTVRIELCQANETDYENLDLLMEQAGFSCIITSDNGWRYRLPAGEFNVEGSFNIEAVFDAARSAAVSTQRGFVVLVNESVRRKWEGLQRAQSVKR